MFIHWLYFSETLVVKLILDAPDDHNLNHNYCDGTTYDEIADLNGASQKFATGQIAGIAMFTASYISPLAMCSYVTPGIFRRNPASSAGKTSWEAVY